MQVKHKKGRATTPQLVILYRHTISFLENAQGTKRATRQEVVDQYSLSLISKCELDKKHPKCLVFLAKATDQMMGKTPRLFSLDRLSGCCPDECLTRIILQS